MKTRRIAIGFGLLGALAAATYLVLAQNEDQSMMAVDRSRAVDIEIGYAALSPDVGLARLQDTYPSLDLACRENDQMTDVMGDQVCVAPVTKVNRLPATTATFHLKDKQLIAMRVIAPPTAHRSWLEYLDRNYAMRRNLTGQVDGSGVPLVGWAVAGGTVLASASASTDEAAIVWIGKNTVAHAAIASAQVADSAGGSQQVSPLPVATQPRAEIAKTSNHETATATVPGPAVTPLSARERIVLTGELRAHDEERAKKSEAVKALVQKLAEQRRGEVFE